MKITLADGTVLQRPFGPGAVTGYRAKGPMEVDERDIAIMLHMAQTRPDDLRACLAQWKYRWPHVSDAAHRWNCVNEKCYERNDGVLVRTMRPLEPRPWAAYQYIGCSFRWLTGPSGGDAIYFATAEEAMNAVDETWE